MKDSKARTEDLRRNKETMGRRRTVILAALVVVVIGITTAVAIYWKQNGSFSSYRTGGERYFDQNALLPEEGLFVSWKF